MCVRSREIERERYIIVKLYAEILLRILYVIIGFLLGYFIGMISVFMSMFMGDPGTRAAIATAKICMWSPIGYPIGGILAAVTGYWIFLFFRFHYSDFHIFLCIKYRSIYFNATKCTSYKTFLFYSIY